MPTATKPDQLSFTGIKSEAVGRRPGKKGLGCLNKFRRKDSLALPWICAIHQGIQLFKFAPEVMLQVYKPFVCCTFMEFQHDTLVSALSCFCYASSNFACEKGFLYLLEFSQPSVCYHCPQKRSEIAEDDKRVVDGGRCVVIKIQGIRQVKNQKRWKVTNHKLK